MTFHPDTLCPFCGLGCGDIGIDRNPSDIAPRPSGCPEADRLFRRSMAVPTDARLDRTAISMDEAIAEAVRLLESSRAPLIAGLAADVKGVLAAFSLAEASARPWTMNGRMSCSAIWRSCAASAGPDADEACRRAAVRRTAAHWFERASTTRAHRFIGDLAEGGHGEILAMA